MKRASVFFCFALLAVSCTPSVATLASSRRHGELACRMSEEGDDARAALIEAAQPRVRVNAYALQGAKELEDEVFVAVEARVTGLEGARIDVRLAVEPAVDVMEDGFIGGGLYQLTGEKPLAARKVEVSSTHIDEENAKWALVTFGLSVLAGKQVFETRTHEETVYPTDAERAAASPKATEIAAFLRARVPDATWFAVKKSKLAAARVELRLLVSALDKHCDTAIVLASPLAIVPGTFTGEFRPVRDGMMRNPIRSL